MSIEGMAAARGTDGFHAALAEQWELIASYEIPQWHGIHDDARVCVCSPCVRVSHKRRVVITSAR